MKVGGIAAMVIAMLAVFLVVVRCFARSGMFDQEANILRSGLEDFYPGSFSEWKISDRRFGNPYGWYTEADISPKPIIIETKYKYGRHSCTAMGAFPSVGQSDVFYYQWQENGEMRAALKTAAGWIEVKDAKLGMRVLVRDEIPYGMAFFLIDNVCGCRIGEFVFVVWYR